MADDDTHDGEAQRPSLEPPRLFRRRPRKAGASPVGSVPVTGPAEVDSEAGTEIAAEEPVQAPAIADDVATADETDVVDDPVVGESLDVAATEEESSTSEPVLPPEPAPVAEPAPAPEPEVAPEPAPDPEVAPEPAAARGADQEAEDRPGFTDAATVPVHVGGDHDDRAPDPAPEPSSEPSPAPAATPREPRTPVLVGRNAALLAGFLVGVLMLLLGAGATSTCEAVRGTSACGAALGLPLLAVVVAIGVVAGALLLRLWHLPSPGSTSFMAVALVAVVTGLFLGEALESWVTRIAFPFGVALAFLAAWWLTVSFDDPDVVRRAREDRERQQV